MRKLGSILGVLLVFAISALALVMIYDKGKDQKPLRYADVPQETIDWINTLGNDLNDILSSFNPFPIPTPWDNKGDYGNDPDSGLKTLEDDYFIFYFPESLIEKAKFCQKEAHKAIPHLKDMMGKYYYPDDMNGRKVPIYLTEDQEGYNEVLSKFIRKNGNQGSAGVTIFEMSPSGIYLHAIALNGKYAFVNDEYTKIVIWHELNHYCFFASLDYNQSINLPMWSFEGIAEYFAYEGERPSFSKNHIEDMRKECNLLDAYFPYTYQVYDGGRSIYCFMEDQYKVSGIKAFIKTLYNSGIPTSMTQNFSISVPEFEKNWKDNLEEFTVKRQ